MLIPEPAWALAQQEEGDRLLEEGKQDYMEGRFEEAIEKLTLAIKLLTDKDKLIDAYLHLALSHFALGEMDKVKENFAGLLRLNPAQRLDPQYYPPGFVKIFDKVKDVILARIRVETEPAAAQVYFDGELVGLTPFQITKVAAGEHKLKLIKEGYKPTERSLLVKESEKKTVSIKLEEEEKKPTVAVTPAEVKVILPVVVSKV